jgi:hypothetical protein
MCPWLIVINSGKVFFFVIDTWSNELYTLYINIYYVDIYVYIYIYMYISISYYMILYKIINSIWTYYVMDIDGGYVGI